MLRHASASFDGESEGDRLARRARNWIAHVEIVETDTPIGDASAPRDHESWHVLQQRQGRMHPSMHMQDRGAPIQDVAGLEQEADAMGAKAKNALR